MSYVLVVISHVLTYMLVFNDCILHFTADSSTIDCFDCMIGELRTETKLLLFNQF